MFYTIDGLKNEVDAENYIAEYVDNLIGGKQRKLDKEKPIFMVPTIKQCKRIWYKFNR